MIKRVAYEINGAVVAVSSLSLLNAKADGLNEPQKLTEKVKQKEDFNHVTTVITVKEQDMVENSSAQRGFVPQENGTGFYFEKSPKN